MKQIHLKTSQLWMIAVCVAGMLGGCANQTQMLNEKQSMAVVDTAVDRGRFTMNCRNATGEVISREVVQPAMQGPWAHGIPRNEYTVGVTGCNRRHVFIVICPQGGEGCYAAGPGGFIGAQDR